MNHFRSKIRPETEHGFHKWDIAESGWAESICISRSRILAEISAADTTRSGPDSLSLGYNQNDSISTAISISRRFTAFQYTYIINFANINHVVNLSICGSGNLAIDDK